VAEAALMSGGDLIAVAPWIIFGAALAAVSVRMLRRGHPATRRRQPRRGAQGPAEPGGDNTARGARTRSAQGNHPDAEQISLCRDGGLARDHAAVIRAHVASCLGCQRLDSRLSELRTLVGQTVAPPMPAELSARIDQALTAEQAHRDRQCRDPAS
jgi:hypothetical protein